MTPSITMLLLAGILVAAGVYLMMERSLTRVLLGFILVGNGANIVLLLAAGAPGTPPLTDGENLSAEGMTDPLPQALILTAIVITFGLTAFLLAMIYRSWRLARQDIVEDDDEDARIGQDTSGSDEAGTDEDYEDTEFGDEAERPVDGALDLDDDGTPTERAEAERQEEAAEARQAEDGEPVEAEADAAQAPSAEHPGEHAEHEADLSAPQPSEAAAHPDSQDRTEPVDDAEPEDTSDDEGEERR